jgi:hypothetical protein
MHEETVPRGNQNFRFNLQDELPGYYHVVLNASGDKYTRVILNLSDNEDYIDIVPDIRSSAILLRTGQL